MLSMRKFELSVLFATFSNFLLLLYNGTESSLLPPVLLDLRGLYGTFPIIRPAAAASSTVTRLSRRHREGFRSLAQHPMSNRITYNEVCVRSMSWEEERLEPFEGRSCRSKVDFVKRSSPWRFTFGCQMPLQFTPWHAFTYHMNWDPQNPCHGMLVLSTTSSILSVRCFDSSDDIISLRVDLYVVRRREFILWHSFAHRMIPILRWDTPNYISRDAISNRYLGALSTEFNPWYNLTHRMI
jgi:hypothetical protein